MHKTGRMKKILPLLISLTLAGSVFLSGCGQQASAAGVSKDSSTPTIQKVLDKKKLVIGTAPGYLPFEMKDKQGNFIGYDIDLGNAIGAALKVPVEFKQFEFAGLIPALQTGDIDMLIAGMTIRGDRALSVSFSNPYYATGQVLMVSAKDQTANSWEDLDQAGKKIAVSQGTTGALLAKQIYKNAKVVDYQDFPTAGMALLQGQADGIVYDEPAIRMFETMNKAGVRGIYTLISNENLGIAVRHDDFGTVQWLNSFLYAYKGSPTELKSLDKWFKSKDWIDTVEQKKK